MSVDSALRVLEAFRHGPTTMSLSEISRRTGIPLSSTHRVVGQLHAWGALERGEDLQYRVGLRLWEVAAQAPRAVGLKRMAMPFLQDLYETVHLSVHLAVREGQDVVFIERFTSRSHHAETPKLGDHYPLHATAVGMVLLAHAPADVQRRVLAEEMAPLTPYTETDPKVVRRELAAVRKAGYGLSHRAFNPDIVAVGAPISDGQDVVAALSVIVPVDEWHPVAHPQVVRATARAISQTLGAR